MDINKVFEWLRSGNLVRYKHRLLRTLDTMASPSSVALEEMIHLARTSSFLVADMPFGSYNACPEDGVRNAVRLIQEGCVEGVKIEGGPEVVECVRKLTGLLPQRHTALSGYKVQGKDYFSAQRVLRAAYALQAAWVSSIVLEAISRQLGTYITKG